MFKRMSSRDHEPSNESPGGSASRSDGQDSRTWSFLKQPDQVVGGGLLVVLLVLMIVKWGTLSGWGSRPVEITQVPAVENRFRLNINSATAVEWSQLDGIGEVLAARIVEDRNTNGPFESLDDLLRVEGIGRQTLEQIRPWLTTKQNQKNNRPTTRN